MDNRIVGKRIAGLRKERNMTQKQLADLLNVTDRAVSRWERGVGAPDISLLTPLATALNITTDELLGSPPPAKAPAAPAYIPTRTGIPLFYHYVCNILFIGGWLIVVTGLILGSQLQSLATAIIIAAIGLAIMLTGTVASVILHRCPVCGHVLWMFHPKLSQYTSQYCSICGKAVYSDHSVRTLKEYRKYRKEGAVAECKF